MAKKYNIWDKVTPIITPVGEVFTPQQWIDRYPAAGLETVTVVCSAGEVNGGFFSTLGQMKLTYENMGLVFSGDETPDEVLQKIELFEDSLNASTNEPTAEERMAAAMEFQNLLSM